MTSFLLLPGLLLLGLWAGVKGHGRLLEPPSRASMWRVGFNTPINYNDNQLFCGGFTNQQSHDGKCGVCGDPWQGPRDHEAGGKYATGTISRTYTQGQKVTVTVQITANHKGWFEFRLCPVNNKKVKATHDCFNQNVLRLADGSGTRYPIGSENKKYHIDIVLPSNVTCSQCVMQWKYHTGNNWGADSDGKQCVGCGPQEEFYGCSDITIIAGAKTQQSSTRNATTGAATASTTKTTTSVSATPTTVESGTSTVRSTTASPTEYRATSQGAANTCYSGGIKSDDIVSNAWCSSNCGSGVCRKVLICV